jgi:cell division protein YceG involved in septum cleavage
MIILVVLLLLIIYLWHQVRYMFNMKENVTAQKVQQINISMDKAKETHELCQVLATVEEQQLLRVCNVFCNVRFYNCHIRQQRSAVHSGCSASTCKIMSACSAIMFRLPYFLIYCSSI